MDGAHGSIGSDGEELLTPLHTRERSESIELLLGGQIRNGLNRWSGESNGQGILVVEILSPLGEAVVRAGVIPSAHQGRRATPQELRSRRHGEGPCRRHPQVEADEAAPLAVEIAIPVLVARNHSGAADVIDASRRSTTMGWRGSRVRQ